MKIIVVQDHLRSGGTERQAQLLTRGFAAAGHAALLLTFRPGGALAGRAPGVQAQALQPFDTRLDWWAPGLIRRVTKLQPDVVLCMGRMANCYGGWLQRALPQTAVIATLRTGKPLPWLFRRSLKSVRHIVANSHEARQVLQAREQVPDARISVIHNSLVFPPLATAPSGRTALRAAQGATEATVVLLSVAMFRPEKNQRALVELVRHVPRSLNWQLWLGGDGPTRASCEARSRHLGLSDRVRFLGWVADPRALYQAADVAVLASRRESLSNFLIEAQAAGLPAVAYEALGVGETFRPGESGYLIRRDDETAFVERLRELCEDAALRARLGASAAAYAREHFAPERQLQAYLTLFRRLQPAADAPGSVAAATASPPA